LQQPDDQGPQQPAPVPHPEQQGQHTTTCKATKPKLKPGSKQGGSHKPSQAVLPRRSVMYSSSYCRRPGLPARRGWLAEQTMCLLTCLPCLADYMRGMHSVCMCPALTHTILAYPLWIKPHGSGQHGCAALYLLPSPPPGSPQMHSMLSHERQEAPTGCLPASSRHLPPRLSQQVQHSFLQLPTRFLHQYRQVPQQYQLVYSHLG
jgi:hypothetical protein